MSGVDADAVVNISIAITGHVDAGKTSLVRALSTELSTAALDKNPQSQARGITLDLGFSAFVTDMPQRLAAASSYTKRLQFTLVDCPGHASLIRTIIGGAQIIDMILLVVDVVKGFQTQTAECLVVAEIMTDKLIVILNKIDLLPPENREKLIERATQRVRKVLAPTKFNNAPIIVLSAAPGGAGKLGAAAPLSAVTGLGISGGEGGDGLAKEPLSNVRGLIEALLDTVEIPVRKEMSNPFLFAIDHCFPIKGQGTVLTGTVLAGTLKINDSIEITSLRQEKKVKSIQMFKRPVNVIRQGDRAGICVTNLDASSVERGIAAAPGTVPTLSAAIALVKKIRYYTGPCESESKFHVTVGHTTVMATAVFFGAQELAELGIGGRSGFSRHAKEAADADERSTHIVLADSANTALANLSLSEGGTSSSRKKIQEGEVKPGLPLETSKWGVPLLSRDLSLSWEWQNELLGRRSRGAPPPPSPESKEKEAPSGEKADGNPQELVYEWQWVALLFEVPILTPLGSMIIGSKLDGDVNANVCRLAFFGRLVEQLSSAELHSLGQLKLFKMKKKEGVIDRIDSKSEESSGSSFSPIVVIGRSLFKKETDMSQFVGLKVHTRAGQEGVIDSSFGKSGKFKATFANPNKASSFAAALGAGKTLSEARLAPSLSTPPPPINAGDVLFLHSRKYIFSDSSSRFSQEGLFETK
jgi:selenocysteine-specific elongation factor